MGIRWTKTREFEVACELFVREGSGPYVPAEQGDLRRACEAVGLVVESGSDRKSALDDAGQAGFARGCSLHAAQVGPDGQIETPGLGSLAARNAAAIAAIHNAYPELAAEVRALRERVAKAESEDEAEFAERKRIAEASDRRIVEASEKALEHLEARMRAEAERDALRERAAMQDAELVALREAVLAGEAAVRSSANAIDDYHADAFAVALAKVPR